MGRFISEDPIQDGVNWYVYVSNNPLKFVDPTGLDPHQNGGKPHEQSDVERQGDPDDDGDNDNGGARNNTTGQTPAPEPEKKNAWEAFKDFFGFGDDEDGNKKKGPIERLDDWVLRGKIERATRDAASKLGIDPEDVSDEMIDELMEAIQSSGRTEYIGFNIVFPNPRALFSKATMQPDAFTVSVGIYVGQNAGQKISPVTALFFGGETGVYGTIGGGNGTPNLSAGVEYGFSWNSSPNTVLSDTSVESGVKIGFLELSGFGSDGKFCGMEISIGTSIIPFDAQTFIEKSGHIKIFE